MSKRTIGRASLAALVLIATSVAFVVYFRHHPEVRQQLSQLSIVILISLLALYVIFTCSLALINAALVRLCRATIPAADSLLLTMYSAVINFFGPLQSGPAFRGLYLHKKYGVGLKDYGAATLVYYGFYSFYSLLLLVSGLLSLWLMAIGLIVLLVVWSRRGWLSRPRLAGLDWSAWYYMAGATLLQVGLLALIFYIELTTVQAGVRLSQVLIYTGAANLAVFVSLTPGAIGFREAFLVFTQNLHHIDNSTILAANLIDRSVYIVLLLLAAAVIFGTHANRRLKARAAD